MFSKSIIYNIINRVIHLVFAHFVLSGLTLFAGEPMSGFPVPEIIPVKELNDLVGSGSEKGLVLSAETGKPVPQAMLLLTGEKDRYSCQSDKDGIYYLSGIKPGKYRIKAGKKGFAFYEREGVVLIAGENPFREIRLDRSILKGQII
jgi:hypothetical protein